MFAALIPIRVCLRQLNLFALSSGVFPASVCFYGAAGPLFSYLLLVFLLANW
jgi:hypothetical protein